MQERTAGDLVQLSARAAVAYHFDAANRMGQAYLELGNQVSALECFRRALRLNPNLEGVRVQIDRLSRMIEGR